jgi:ABC-type lipoprotein release transport system permease subunit
MTVIAVATSMALLISMQAISDGLLQNARSTIEKSKVDISISVTDGHGIENGHTMMSTLKTDPRVRYASIYMTEYIAFMKPGSTKQLWAITEGLVPAETKPLLPANELDRFPKDGYLGFKEGGDPHFSNNFTGAWTYEVLIDKNIGSTLDLKKGDQILIARTSTGPYTTFNVSGVFDSQLSGSGLAAKLYFMSMHLSELQSLTGNDIFRDANGSRVVDRVDQAALGLQLDIRTSKEKVVAFQKELEAKYPFYEVDTKMDRLVRMEQQMIIVKGFFLAIGGVSLMIGLLFVTCIMFMSILERTNEIGMLRAIGISKGTIFLQILAESMIIVIIGAALGIIPGYFGSIWGSEYIKSTVGTTENLVLFNLPSVAQLFVEVILLGGMMSLLPAWRAMSIDIIKSLKRVK